MLRATLFAALFGFAKSSTDVKASTHAVEAEPKKTFWVTDSKGKNLRVVEAVDFNHLTENYASGTKWCDWGNGPVDNNNYESTYSSFSGVYQIKPCKVQ